MHRSCIVAAAFGLALGVAGSAANAQTYLPSECSIEMGEWAFTPVVLEISGVRAVEAFLALRDHATLVGDNIGSVLYVRDTGATGGWSSFGWATQDQWAAIEWVKAEFSIAASHDALWQTTQAAPSTPAAPATPDAFDDGVLESNPLAAVATPSPEWDAIVELLENAGWQTADIPSEESAAETTCPNDPVVGVLAQIVDAVEGGQDVEDAMSDAWDSFLGCLPFCIPMTAHGLPGPVSCGAPGPYGPPVQFPTGPYVYCDYSRTRTCTQSRGAGTIHWDCSLTICLQSRTRTETQTQRCDDSGTLYNGPGIGADPCPATPTCFGATQGGVFTPTSSTSWSGWTPTCP
ncbi:MAG: hypothetical protein H6809_00935 [Phycisphaeraceae bacterium]|nr:hypothetical protein [Phycisphaeraceae bacterium]